MAAKKSQIDKFREAARELEADDDERKFDKSLGCVARHKPKAESSPPAEPVSKKK